MAMHEDIIARLATSGWILNAFGLRDSMLVATPSQSRGELAESVPASCSMMMSVSKWARYS